MSVSNHLPIPRLSGRRAEIEAHQRRLSEAVGLPKEMMGSDYPSILGATQALVEEGNLVLHRVGIRLGLHPYGSAPQEGRLTARRTSGN